jgi:hypothetical protein
MLWLKSPYNKTLLISSEPYALSKPEFDSIDAGRSANMRQIATGMRG